MNRPVVRHCLSRLDGMVSLRGESFSCKLDRKASPDRFPSESRMNNELFRLFNVGMTASMNAIDARRRGDMAAGRQFDLSALDAFDKALAIDSQYVSALSGKGLTLAQLGRTTEAIRIFQQALTLEPNHPENLHQLGLCFAQLGNMPSAREALLRSVQLEERVEFRRNVTIEVYNFGGHLMRLASERQKAGDHEAARRYYHHATGVFGLVLDLDRENPRATQALGVAEQCLRMLTDGL